MNRPAIFFDRDNTLIANDGYLGDPGGVVLINGAARAIARARAMGFAVVTISNQSGVARGLFPEEAIHRVNSRMDELLLDQHPNARIDRHEFCPYHPDADIERYKRDSDLRKPRPGMILQAAGRLNLDLEQSWVIGDAPRDIEAGKAAGCRTILFLEPTLKPSSASNEESSVAYDFLATSLQEALDIIEQNKMSNIKPAPAEKPAHAEVDRPGEKAPEAEIEPAAVAAVVEESATPAAVAEASIAPVAPMESGVPEAIVDEPVAAVAVELADPVAVTDSAVTPVAIEKADSQASRTEKSEDSEAKAVESQTAENNPEENKAVPEPTPAPAAPPRKMTFAERVRAGTFQPARSATAGPGAAAVPERPKRAIAGVAVATESASADSRPATAATGVFAVEPGVKPTEPVSDTELLEPLLQQILEEVRLMRQQHPGTEFAVTKLLAGIVQVLVLPALFFAYLHRDVSGDLQSMLLLATFLQTLTIALLIMGRQQ